MSRARPSRICIAHLRRPHAHASAPATGLLFTLPAPRPPRPPTPSPCSALAPGNPTVCRELPYVGQYLTCFGSDGWSCDQPVQLRANCSSNQPGWVPFEAPRPRGGSLTGLQTGLVVAGVSLVAACTALATVLFLRYREQQRWQVVKSADGELGFAAGGKDSLAELIAATAARKRGGHSALAQRLLKECAIAQGDILFCRDGEGNLVQLGAGAYGQVRERERGLHASHAARPCCLCMGCAQLQSVPHLLSLPPAPPPEQVYKAFLYGVHPVAVKVFQTQDDVPAGEASSGEEHRPTGLPNSPRPALACSSPSPRFAA